MAIRVNYTIQSTNPGFIGSPYVPSTILVNSIPETPAGSGFFTVTENTEVDLLITATNHYSYSNQFRVYEEDINIVIYLQPDNYATTDPEYQKPYPAFFSIQNPCSYNIDLYNASSYQTGISEYYLDGELICQGDNIVANFNHSGSFNIERRIYVQQATNNCNVVTYNIIHDQYFGNSFYTTLGFDPFSQTVNEYKPTISAALVHDVLLDPPTDFYLPNESAEIQPDFEWVFHTFTKEGVLDQTNTNIDLTYEVINNTSSVTESTTSFSFDDSTYTNSSDYNWTFSVPDSVNFTVRITAITFCGTFVKEYVYSTTNEFIRLSSQDGCGQYTLSNLSSTVSDMTFSVSDLTNNVIINAQSVPVNSSSSFELTDDGTYTVEINYTDASVATTKFKIIHKYCVLEECLALKFQEILCNENADCSKEEDCDMIYDTNRIIALSMTFFALVNDEYNFHNIYDSLSSTKLVELNTIQDTFDQLKKYCGISDSLSGCGCGCNE